MINTIRKGECDFSFEDEKKTKRELKRYFEKYLNEQNYKIKYCFKIKDGPLTWIWSKIYNNIKPIM